VSEDVTVASLLLEITALRQLLEEAGPRRAAELWSWRRVPHLGVGQSSPGDGGRAIATESRESRAKARAQSARAGCAAPGRADAAGAAECRRSSQI